jgi:hypothetical protein
MLSEGLVDKRFHGHAHAIEGVVQNDASQDSRPKPEAPDGY